MELKDIEILLEKYWNGTTSVAEEKNLQSLLKNQSHPAFASQKQYFESLEQFQHLSSARQWKKPPSTNADDKTKSSSHLYRKMIAAAALIACIGLFTSLLFFQKPQQVETAKASSLNTHSSYQQALAALVLMGEKLDKSTKTMEALKKFDKATHRLKHFSSPKGDRAAVR